MWSILRCETEKQRLHSCKGNKTANNKHGSKVRIRKDETQSNPLHVGKYNNIDKLFLFAFTL